MAQARIIERLARFVRIGKQENADGYRRGYMFGQREPLVEDVHRLKKNSKMERTMRGSGTFPWYIWDTPLSKYTFYPSQEQPDGARFDFERYIGTKANEANAEGRMLRVLDVGVGSGKQWLGFLRGRHVDFHATALRPEKVAGELRERVAMCSAAQLHRKFAPDFFDAVVSHYGTHFQVLGAIENALWVLRAGGEVIMSGEDVGIAHFDKNGIEGRFFEILGEEIRTGPVACGGHWFLHMKKLPPQ